MQTSKTAYLSLSAAAGTVLLILGLVGCASGPNPALERAQAAYTQARQNPDIVANAAVPLSEAEATLQKAERVWREEGDDKEVQHLAYVAERKVELAKAVSDRKAAEQEQTRLNDAKGNVLLSARTREAEMAKQKAARLEQELAELKARETERGLVLTLDDVLFEVDKADLKPGALLKLAPLAQFLRENPNRSVLIEGHTDNTGTSPYNLELSQRRAETVQMFLVQQGIDPARVIARGYGEAFPLAPNDNSAGRQQNRRVEVVILHEGEVAANRLRPTQGVLYR